MQTLNNDSLYSQKLHEFQKEKEELIIRFSAADKRASFALYNKHLYPGHDTEFFLDLQKKRIFAALEYRESIDILNRKIYYATESLFEEMVIRSILNNENIIAAKGTKRKRQETPEVEKKPRI